MNIKIGRLLTLLVFCFPVRDIPAQAGKDKAVQQELPVTKISIFSSGLAYNEHSGTLNGPAAIPLPLKAEAVNDALKSLVINDPASANPSVSYRSEQTLIRTLQSLKIDLSDDPDIAGILHKLRGAEVEITVPSTVRGRIIGVESRQRTAVSGDETSDPWLSLYTEQGIRMFNFMDIGAINFIDVQLGADLKRALDLIAQSRHSDTRELTVSLPGDGSRKVSLSYVIPSPVWKVSYRLDLGQDENAEPLFQGWAIVDNDGDSDWENVELSLVAGRPSSFIQNLYPPYYLSRPVLPLAIAGAAAAETHDTGYGAPGYPGAVSESAMRMRSPAPMMMMADELAANAEIDDGGYSGAGLAGGAIEGALGAAAGDQFEFTVKNPVSLDRRMSAMIPLVEAKISAEKLLIFSGANASANAGRSLNPRIGAELTNTSGMKLPAGPITVYDGGTYAGDALIEFWNEGEKRLVSYGEDLSVSGTVMDAGSRAMVSVKIAEGVMTLNRNLEYVKTYTFLNKGSQEKRLLIEHPKNQGAVLESPDAGEQTPSSYRFTVALPAGKELAVAVRETRPVMEQVRLLQLRPDAFLSYTSSQEIPQAVKEALRQAMDLRSAVNAAETAVNELEKQRAGFVSEQDRIRKNLEAAGSQTQQGQEYLKRLLSLDESIDFLVPELDKLRANVRNAQKAYEDYLKALSL